MSHHHKVIERVPELLYTLQKEKLICIHLQYADLHHFLSHFISPLVKEFREEEIVSQFGYQRDDFSPGFIYLIFKTTELNNSLKFKPRFNHAYSDYCQKHLGAKEEASLKIRYNDYFVSDLSLMGVRAGEAGNELISKLAGIILDVFVSQDPEWCYGNNLQYVFPIYTTFANASGLDVGEQHLFFEYICTEYFQRMKMMNNEEGNNYSQVQSIGKEAGDEDNFDKSNFSLPFTAQYSASSWLRDWEAACMEAFKEIRLLQETNKLIPIEYKIMQIREEDSNIRDKYSFMSIFIDIINNKLNIELSQSYKLLWFAKERLRSKSILK